MYCFIRTPQGTFWFLSSLQANLSAFSGSPRKYAIKPAYFTACVNVMTIQGDVFSGFRNRRPAPPYQLREFTPEGDGVGTRARTYHLCRSATCLLLDHRHDPILERT